MYKSPPQSFVNVHQMSIRTGTADCGAARGAAGWTSEVSVCLLRLSDA